VSADLLCTGGDYHPESAVVECTGLVSQRTVLGPVGRTRLLSYHFCTGRLVYSLLHLSWHLF